MSNEVEKVNTKQLHTVSGPMTMNGDYSTQIANVENYDDSTHTMILLSERQGNHKAEDIDTNIMFDNSCYHLFVLDEEHYDGSSFIVKKEVSLTESTPENLQTLCGSFSQDAIERIKTYPAIFANLNHQYKKTDEDHQAHFGYVIGIEVLNEGIKVSYVPLKSFPQQLLNENLAAFGLDSAWGINELDNIHWAIKKVNLVDTLKNLGLRVLSY